MSYPAGIETTYKGTTFRSRLEARWAMFFDCVEWDWEYEPFDANGYIPDFVLLGDRPVLVEVKPAASQRELELHVPRLERALTGHWAQDILIVGVKPYDIVRTDCWRDQPCIGWLGEGDDYYVSEGCPSRWAWDAGVWWRCAGLDGVRNDGLADHGWCFNHEVMSYMGRPCGHYWGGHSGMWPDNRYWGNHETTLGRRQLEIKWDSTRDATRWMPG